MSGAWRYWTDCLTGLRHWRLYSRVWRPEHSLVWPCAKAAAVGIPFIFVPGAGYSPAVPPVYPAPPAWLEGRDDYPYLYWAPPIGGEMPLWAPRSDLISPVSTPFSTVPPSEILTPATITDVPEPSSIVLVGVGAGAAVLVRRRRG